MQNNEMGRCPICKTWGIHQEQKLRTCKLCNWSNKLSTKEFFSIKDEYKKTLKEHEVLKNGNIL